MFLTLLRKDWRIAKPAFLFMLTLFFVPPTTGVLLTVYSRLFENEKTPLTQYNQFDHNNLMELILTGYILCIFGAPTVASSQFGREHRERTSSFLGALAIPQSKIVASKTLMTFALFTLPAFIAWSSGLSMIPNSTQGQPIEINERFIAITIGLLGISGIAWLLSCILSSEILATALAFAISAATAIAIYLAFSVVPSLRSLNPVVKSDTISLVVMLTAAFFAIVGFSSGILIALKRRTL